MLLSIVETQFAVVMFKRFELIKGGLQSIFTSDKWLSYSKNGAIFMLSSFNMKKMMY